jgi:hypothetical protein
LIYRNTDGTALFEIESRYVNNKKAKSIARKAIYRHGPQITVSRQEACDLRVTTLTPHFTR